MKTIYNRLFMLTMTIMISLSSFAVRTLVESVQIDGIYYRIISEKNSSPYAITELEGESNNEDYSGDITIPSSVTYEVDYEDVTFPVIQINWGSFRYCKNIKSVTLPNSVIEIQKGSFEGCALSSVTIPCTTINIGEGAFNGCTNLTSVTNLSCVPQNINYYFEKVFEVYGDLHVLKGRKQAYQDAPIWNKFNIIDDVETTPTMVKETIDAIDNVQKIYATDPVKKLNIVKTLIINARIAFDALSKEQQAQVKNINLLIEAEEAYGESTTGIANINSDNDKKDGKYLENGKIVIKKNDKKFNINGLNE